MTHTYLPRHARLVTPVAGVLTLASGVVAAAVASGIDAHQHLDRLPRGVWALVGKILTMVGIPHLPTVTIGASVPHATGGAIAVAALFAAITLASGAWQLLRALRRTG
jgi:hypothetical protein